LKIKVGTRLKQGVVSYQAKDGPGRGSDKGTKTLKKRAPKSPKTHLGGNGGQSTTSFQEAMWTLRDKKTTGAGNHRRELTRNMKKGLSPKRREGVTEPTPRKGMARFLTNQENSYLTRWTGEIRTSVFMGRLLVKG